MGGGYNQIYLFFEKRLQDLPHIFRDDAVSGGGGVDAVGLVEAGDPADVLEEEGDEGGVVICGQFGEDVFECVGISGAHIGRDLHAGDDDRGVGVVCLYGVDDGLQVGDGSVEGYSAEAVVAAEFEDEDVHRLAKDPADTGAAVGGGLPADTGVDDCVGQAEGIDEAADEGGEGLIWIDAVAGGEAIAEEEDGFGVGGWGGIGGGIRWL